MTDIEDGDDYGDNEGDSRRESILADVRAGRSATRRSWITSLRRDRIQTAPMDLTDEQKMNVRDWVAALESGDYAQTKHVLTWVSGPGRRSYCCLGVLCKTLHLPEERRTGPVGPVIVYIGDDDVAEHQSLPYGVPAMVGLTQSNPIVFGRFDAPHGLFSDGWTAATLNDELSMSLSEIAEVLRHWYSADDVWPESDEKTGSNP